MCMYVYVFVCVYACTQYNLLYYSYNGHFITVTLNIQMVCTMRYIKDDRCNRF